ncbi:DnaT-like ssDNA-binding domain-containing protein [Marinomonas balearica]|uniref:DnaT DNA-binding domain-containing protein n=1 Tax=Marinomonas balearica TaxID=491947 RepID=A0A4R6MCM2_9GAMM|nr:DnaT-like ssDNA-binding domain-containing protein [Marinomonas balearica]TDO98915.1 hypothetical protein DFP79_1330 [Marinomonas balearica]
MVNGAHSGKLLRPRFLVIPMHDSEFTLPLSFKLASEIGLEESVLLSFLRQHAFMSRNTVLHFPDDTLTSLLSFWTTPILIRHLNSLQAMGQLKFRRTETGIDVQLATQTGAAQSANASLEAAHSQSAQPNGYSSQVENDVVSKVGKLQRAAKEKGSMAPNEGYSANRVTPAARVKSPGSQPRHTQPMAQNHSAQTDSNFSSGYPAQQDRRGVSDFDIYLEQKERTRQPDQWLPEEATIEQICQSGIPRQFAVELQTEFLLRIREQRKNVRTWNSEFFKYVKRQWQYKQSDRQSYEGTSVSSPSGKSSREQISSALTNIHDTDW